MKTSRLEIDGLELLIYRLYIKSWDLIEKKRRPM